MSLLILQRAFRAYLRDEPTDLPGLVRPEVAGGLNVYHHAFQARLCAALRDSFERTHDWLGDQAFDAAAALHVKDVPPSSWSLGHYGDGFAARLDKIYPGDPEVGEIAELDWALRRAFDASDAEPIGPEQLCNVDWNSATIELSPSLKLLKVKTNAAALWAAMSAGETPPPARRLPRPASIRVWRQGLSPHFATINQVEARALAMISQRVTFPAMCEAMASKAEIAELGELLGEWVRDGLIVGISQAYATLPVLPGNPAARTGEL